MKPAASSPRERDAAARRAAQRVFDRPLALEAGAGTGKTATLVARIVAWCLGPGWEEAERDAAADTPVEDTAARVLDGVVAITFTEDAAAEMAERVAEAFRALEGWAGSGELPEELPGLDRGALPEDPVAIRNRARALLVQIERLGASTIHAFASAILARFPVEAGLHPAFTVDAEESTVQELVERAAEEELAAAYASGAEDALALAERGLGPAEVTEVALKLVSRAVPSTLLREDPFTEERIGELLGELRRALEDGEEDLLAMSTVGTKSRRVMAAATFLLQVLELLRREELPPGERLAAVLVQIRSDYPPNREAIRKWASGTFGARPPEKLVQDRMRAAAQRLQGLLPTVARMDPPTFDLLRRVLLAILERVETEKRRRGVVVFQDLLVGARKLLEHDGAVRRKLRAEIRQLLVDEMQDTDPEQAAMVRLLALGDDPGPRPCLFLVGDPKQSIYGWRSADLAVYERLVEEIVAAGGERHELVVNFRSVPPVLDEVRRVVEPNMQQQPGVQPPFVPLEVCERLDGAEGFTGEAPRRRPVEHWNLVALEPGEEGVPRIRAKKALTAETARLEAAAVARDIASLRDAGVKLAEMAVLMRSWGKLQVLLQALRERGIPYAVGRDHNFFRTREVVEAGALLRLVLDPHDPLALAAVLRSPLAGVPDAALAPLWRRGLPRLVAELDSAEEGLPAVLEGAVTEAAVEVESLDVPVDGLEKLSGWSRALLAFLGILGRLRRAWREEPPDRFLELLRQRTLVEPLAAARFPGAHRLANVDRFLGALAEQLLAGATAGELLRWLRRVARERPDQASGRPREEVEEAVRVLTIHGAKGLEFEHVWLIQTHAGKGTGGGGGTDAGRVEHRGSTRWELSLAGLPSPGYHALEEHRDRVAEAEETRLLYVALTRAKQRLVTSGSWNTADETTGPLLARQKRRSTPAGNASAGWPALDELLEAMAQSDETADARVEFGEALWCLPSLPAWRAGMEASTRAGPAGQAACREAIARDETRLRTLRAGAAARQARPWLGGMSHEAHRRLAEAVAASAEGAETTDEEAAPRRGGVPRDLATAVGSAVHRVLERFDLGAGDPDAALDAAHAEAAAWLEAAVAPGDLDAARRRLAELLDTFRRGPLWDRLRRLALAGRVLARELPVLLPPPEEPGNGDDPVGALRGFVDLLYRDPDTGALVIADYKTDDPEHLEERTEAYRSQLALYAEALRGALHLPAPPRTELWFLAAGERVKLEDPGR